MPSWARRAFSDAVGVAAAVLTGVAAPLIQGRRLRHAARCGDEGRGILDLAELVEECLELLLVGRDAIADRGYLGGRAGLVVGELLLELLATRLDLAGGLGVDRARSRPSPNPRCR